MPLIKYTRTINASTLEAEEQCQPCDEQAVTKRLMALVDAALEGTLKPVAETQPPVVKQLVQSETFVPTVEEAKTKAKALADIVSPPVARDLFHEWLGDMAVWEEVMAHEDLRTRYWRKLMEYADANNYNLGGVK